MTVLRCRVLLVAVGLAISACSSSEASQSSAGPDGVETTPVQSVPVQTIEVVERPFEITVVLSGTVSSPTVTKVEVPDESVAEVKIGESVTPGTLLASPDRRLEKVTAVSDAELSLRRAEQDLATLSANRWVDRNVLLQAERAVEDAARSVERSTASATVFSPIAGTVSSIGEDEVSIQPHGLTLAAAIEPSEALRLLDATLTDAKVEVVSTDLPAFRCVDLIFDSGTDPTKQVLSCSAPDDVDLVPGLSVLIAVPSVSMDSAVVVPISSLGRNSADELIVNREVGGGEFEQVTVTMGRSDGGFATIEVGLRPGDVIQQHFVSLDGVGE